MILMVSILVVLCLVKIVVMAVLKARAGKTIITAMITCHPLTIEVCISSIITVH